MIFTYKPEGQAEPQTWIINLGKIRSQEMTAIEKRTGLKYGTEFKQAIMMGGSEARQAMLWTLLRRDHHMLRYEDLDWADEEVTLEMDRDEWAATRADVERGNLPDDVKTERLAIIDVAAANAPEPPGKSLTQSETSELNTA